MKTLKINQQKAKTDNKDNLFDLGYDHAFKSRKKNWKEAFKLWSLSAKQGHVRALFLSRSLL